MTKKILFLFTLLLLAMGGSSVWAGSHTIVFNYDEDGLLRTQFTRPTGGNSTTIVSSPITLTFISTSARCVNSNTTVGEMKFEGANNDAKDNGSSLQVSCLSNALITSISFTSAATGNVNKFTASAGTYTAESSSTIGTWTGSTTSVTFTTEKGNVDKITSISVTYSDVLIPYSGSYPYTWVFNYGGDDWLSTTSTMLSNDGTNWQSGFVGVVSGYLNKSALSNQPLMVGSDEMPETKGLKFTADANEVGTTLKWEVMLTGGASVTIPAKAGHKVEVYGYWPAQTMTLINATEDTGNASTFMLSAAGIATYTFTATADNVTLTVGSENVFIYSIAIKKSDLTTFAFNNTESYYGKSEPTTSHSTGADIGKTTTFKYKIGRDQVLRTRVDVAPGFTDTGIEVNTTNFSVSSDASAVLDDFGYSLQKPSDSDSKIYYCDVKVKKPGTASLTYSFNGTDAYNAKDYTELFTIQKDDIDLKFDEDFVVKTVGEAAFTNSFKLNGLTLPVADDYAPTIYTNSFEYEAKTVNDKQQSNIVSVSTTGVVTLISPGAVLIHAKLKSTDWYNGVDRKYTLFVNPSGGINPVLQWSPNVNDVSVPYNNAVSHTATGTIGEGQTIKYRSADTSVASVDADGKVTGTGRGSTTIYAYVEPTSTHNYAEIYYNVTVTSAGELKSFKFIPNNGKVNNGKSITPKLAFPTIPASGVTSLKVTQIEVTEREGNTVSQTFTDNEISNCDIISVDAFDDLRNNWELDGVNKVFKVNVTIKGKKVGKARITVTFVSEYYNTATATYDVEVTDAETRNFSWADGTNPEYYTYAGDFMMLPALTGNSNGNYNYSSGAKNSSSYTEGGDSHSALHAYEYERKWDGSTNFNITWNNKNIKIGEGFPDFAIVTDGISSPGTASVFFGRGEGSSHPDTLMVYCEKAGDVKLRAYDPQDHTKYCDATIHILPISNIEGTDGSATTVKNGMTYPYTWDFTTDFNMATMVGTTDQYWIPIKDNSGKPTGDYTNGYGFFNLDWADTNKTPDKVDRLYKYFIAGAGSSATGYMHEFNGMMLQMKGSTSWANKMDRMRILAYDNTDQKGRLEFIGGYHTMKLFLPGEGKRPSNFKIFVKASGTGSVCIMGTDEKAVSGTVKNLLGGAAIYSFDISDVAYTSNGYILMGFEDARVYWIAMSTEEKQVNPHPTSGMRAATYSYGEDLNITYSGEANPGLKAYVASSFSSNSVNLTEAPAKVKSGTGLVLKSTSNKGTYSSCYMIACGKNLESYSSPAPLAEDANYLKPSVEGETIQRFEGTEGQADRYTNFLLSKTYVAYDENTGQTTTESGPTTGWLFLRVNGESDAAPANMSYLHVPGTLRVINTNYSAARRAGEEDDKPASKNMLFINFIDEPDDLGTTDISAVSNDGVAIDNDAWYTLQGVRVSAPTKGGIYIHNGRKVVIK